jgi:hypothetical protein
MLVCVDESGRLKPWYQESFVIGGLLWFCFPIGLFLMWRNATWRTSVKVVITAIFVGLFVVGMIMAATSDQ